MSDNDIPDLASLCADLAHELDGVTITADGDVTSYARGSLVFARVSGSTLEVRLPTDIAAAAVRTPDAELDPDDRGWVRFTPATEEEHAIDRASAWFRTAWRHAEDN